MKIKFKVENETGCLVSGESTHPDCAFAEFITANDAVGEASEFLQPFQGKAVLVAIVAIPLERTIGKGHKRICKQCGNSFFNYEADCDRCTPCTVKAIFSERLDGRAIRLQ